MVGDFYDDQSFAPLVQILAEKAPEVIATKNFLIATMEEPLLVSGISAMPSIHVAVSVFAALWLQQYRRSFLTLSGWTYAVIIYIGSIHLGWHYATDGFVSAIAVTLMWWLSKKYVAWLRGRNFVFGSQGSTSAGQHIPVGLSTNSHSSPTSDFGQTPADRA